MAKLWGGRFSQDSSKLLEAFNASITFDKQLYKQDIKGSIAHAKMLCNKDILSKDELQKIINGLEEIKSSIEKGEFEFNLKDEDIHMAIESALINKIGDIGKKLHTGRSRNDQVALDFRMFVLESNREIKGLLLEVLDSLLSIAKEHTNSIMPGMTHLQHAQPISLAFHLVAWACGFKRDIERLNDDFIRNNASPLGSGALAGTPYGNDREFLANELGFSSVGLNAMDCVSERDFALDLLYSIAVIMMHISRIAEELVLWSSYEFKFITLSDAYCTGSSIMPQKKNPDVPELLRGKSGRAYGNLFNLLTILKALPLAYNKDLQEDKESVFDSVKCVKECLVILKALLDSATFNTQNMLKMAKTGHLSATDLADFLVRNCSVPFRDAHHITGQVVAYAESKGLDISDLQEQEILAIDKRILAGVKEVLDLKASMNARTTQGGTAQIRVMEQIDFLKKFIDSQKD